MRPRLAALLVLLAVLLVVAIGSWRRPAPAAPDASVASAETTAPPRNLRIDFGDARTQAELEAVLERAYRLAPDRRMTGAFAHVSQLLAPGQPAPAVQCEWIGDEWKVSAGSGDAVPLASFPSFRQGLAAAEQWAKQSLATTPCPTGAPDGIATGFLSDALPEQALAQLDRVAASSGVTLALAEQALVACTQLSLVLREDRSSFADSTTARALALLALVRAGGRGDHVREQCALAWAMGYTEESAQLARTLPEGDAIRLLVQRRDEALHEATRRPDAARETKICDLLARARNGDFQGWLDALDAMGGPGPREAFTPLATALAFQRFDVARAVGPTLLRASFRNMPGAPEVPRADSTTLTAFERLLASKGVVPCGTMTGNSLSASRRALFYSGLFAWNQFTQVQLASPQWMQVQGQYLPADSGATGSWFARWQRHLTLDELGEDANLALRADLEDAEVPAAFALSSFDALVDGLPISDDLAARSATRALAARLDSRPDWALEMAFAVQAHVRWPTLTERLLDHVVRVAGDEQPLGTIVLAQMREEPSRLQRLAADPGTEPRVAMAALGTCLDLDSSSAASVLPAFATLTARHPEQWDLTDAHADLLESRGRFAEAERVVLRWCRSADSTQDALDSTFAVTALARLQRKQGRIDQAFRTMGDLAQGMQRDAIEEKARLLVLRGSLQSALVLADKCRERYPQDVGTLAFPVELYWLADRDEEAAAFVAKLPAQPYAIRGEVAECFARAFARRPERAEQALRALRAAVPYHANLAQWIMEKLRSVGDLHMASRLAETAHPGSGIERGFGIANTYQLIAAGRGRAEARDWVSRQALVDITRAVTGGYMAIYGEPELAWEIERDLNEGEYNWVMRAAAWRMDGAKRKDWADTLRAHTPEGSETFYPAITRYLLGDLPEAELLALADTPKHRVEVWYHVGLKAWSEGRARDALLWLVLAMETDSNRDGEYFWSWSTLGNWARRWRVPEKLGIGGRGRA